MIAPLRWIRHQVTDAATAVVAPLVAALLPARISKSLLWRIAGLSWLFAEHRQAVEKSEQRCFGEPVGLLQHWAWTNLMDAMETWRIALGLGPRLDIQGQWPEHPGFVAAGIHYGSGIGALWHLREQGLSPRLVYRPVVRGDMPGRPVLYLWARLRVHLMHRLCPAGAIATGRSSETILEALREQRSTMMLVLDTPGAPDSRWQLTVGGCRVGLRTGGLRLLEEEAPRVTFFHGRFDRDSGLTRLTLRTLDAEESGPAGLMEVMQAAIDEDPCQWVLWHCIEGHCSAPA
ncbi:hypothetical protein [Wenzhouxiangella sediminis]|uniref:Lipid A biosynthesis acyltransferase n=1 Tax=Wenzhouxiangella sediminis TaxID=1792836 RepID=A0A3E1K9U2_9GAMM|nr:hypothetical protein [Wenzhouxiangella sediminis]RFF31008.1 hypothetical protein DZC52_06120 [Wenzhouxiangella sediminis]